MAAAWAAAEVAVWPPGWAMAAARAPVRASQAAFSRSSRAAAAAPLEAAAAAESRRWRPGRRLRGVRSQGAGGGGRRRRGAASGGLPDVASMHACAMPVYQRKKLGPSDAVLSRCARVCAICLCISDAPNSAVHVGMSHVCVALLTKNHLTGCPPLHARFRPAPLLLPTFRRYGEKSSTRTCCTGGCASTGPKAWQEARFIHSGPTHAHAADAQTHRPCPRDLARTTSGV